MNVDLAVRARFAGQTVQVGSSWNFRAQQGGLFQRLLTGSSGTPCPPQPAPHADDSAAPATLQAKTTVAAGGEARMIATFDRPALSYPAVVVKWGDGSATEIPAGAARTVTASHRYTAPASHPVLVVAQR